MKNKQKTYYSNLIHYMFTPILVRKILNTCSLPLEELFIKENRIYTFLNPVSYITAFYSKKSFEKFEAIFADGSILVFFIYLLYRIKVERRSFDMTSIAPKLFEHAQKNAKTVYIVASKQEEIEKAVDIVKERYPFLDIIGYRNGYFLTKIEREHEIKHIINLNPNFLIVGMGTLVQEKFLAETKQAGFSGIGFTCGGFISQTAKGESKVDYYPKWIDKYNVRFIYRMYKEKHTRKRYLQAALIFPFVFFKDMFSKS